MMKYILLLYGHDGNPSPLWSDIIAICTDDKEGLEALEKIKKETGYVGFYTKRIPLNTLTVEV